MEDTKNAQVEEVKEEVVEEAVEKGEPKESTAAFDYEKLAKIVENRQKANEQSVLKGYFKEQGLSADDMAKAIEAFKQQQASAMPDVNALQQQAADATKRAIEAEMHSRAMLMAGELGVDIKAMPFVIRMADTEEVTADGSVNEGKLKASLEQVIEAIPSIKQTVKQGGFQVVGAETTTSQEADDEELYRIFGVPRK